MIFISDRKKKLLIKNLVKLDCGIVWDKNICKFGIKYNFKWW